MRLDRRASCGNRPVQFSHLAPRQARVVELRYFGGLTEEEIVAALAISPRTVRRDWDFAKAWLSRELNR
jgi:DNA-directed RNA polymerase specialized sigma24 family protein